MVFFIWIEKAFGKSTAFFITLIQWVYNVVWFPTIMIFIWSIMTYLINIPFLKTPFGTFLGAFILFWGAHMQIFLACAYQVKYHL